MSVVPFAIADLSEKQWEFQAVGTANKPGLARQLGWRVYHTLRSKGSQPGYPDWTLARDRVIFLELKREDGKPSTAQKDWIRALAVAGAEVYIARPRDLDRLAAILAHRGDPFTARAAVRDAAAQLYATTRAEVRLEPD